MENPQDYYAGLKDLVDDNIGPGPRRQFAGAFPATGAPAVGEGFKQLYGRQHVFGDPLGSGRVALIDPGNLSGEVGLGLVSPPDHAAGRYIRRIAAATVSWLVSRPASRSARPASTFARKSRSLMT